MKLTMKIVKINRNGVRKNKGAHCEPAIQGNLVLIERKMWAKNCGLRLDGIGYPQRRAKWLILKFR